MKSKLESIPHTKEGDQSSKARQAAKTDIAFGGREDKHRNYIVEELHKAGAALVTRAEEVIECALRASGAGIILHSQKLKEAQAEAETLLLIPEEPREPIELTQAKAKVTYTEKIETHLKQTLLHATRVKIISSRLLGPVLIPPLLNNLNLARNALDRMLRAMANAERHLCALEILKNLERKAYSNRAAKGGEAQLRPASAKEEQYIMEILIKNILFNDPDLLTKAAKSSLDTEILSSEIVTRIYNINKEANILKYDNLNAIKNDVLNILVEKLKIHNRKNSWVNQLPKRNFFKPSFYCDDLKPSDNLEFDKINKEESFEQGVIQGAKATIKAFLYSRFGDFSKQHEEALNSISTMDDVQNIYEKSVTKENLDAILGTN